MTVASMVMTGAPCFFLFHAVTKNFYFVQAMARPSPCLYQDYHMVCSSSRYRPLFCTRIITCRCSLSQAIGGAKYRATGSFSKHSSLPRFFPISQSLLEPASDVRFAPMWVLTPPPA